MNRHKRCVSKIVSLNTSDVGGGAERIAWDLFKGYERQGIESWLVVGDKKSKDDRVIPLHASPHLDYRPYGMWSRAKWELRKFFCRQFGIEDFEFPWTHQMLSVTGSSPDVIHCHNLHGGYFDLRALIELSRAVPVFVTLHDAWLSSGHCALSLGCSKWQTGCGNCPDLDIPPAILRDGTARNWHRKAEILQQCQLYIAAPSHWLLNRMSESILSPAIAESRIIPHGIDLARFHPVEKSVARARLSNHVPQNGHLVVFAANQLQNNVFKNQRMLLSALRRLATLYTASPVHFVSIGSAGETERLGNVTVHYVPTTEQSELARFFQAADLYVHAAYEETFGLVIAESMACGTPVVATAVGGIPEVLGKEEAGILVEPGDAFAFADAIRLVLQNDEMRVAMGAAAWRDAQRRFCVERMVSDYLAWVDEQMSRKPITKLPNAA